MSAAFKELAAGSSADTYVEDHSRESSPDQGPSQKQPVKRKLPVNATQAADVSEYDGPVWIKEKLETPAYYVKSSKQGGGKSKNDQIISMMDNRTHMLKDFTNSFSSLVKNKNEDQDANQNVDNIDYWCKILGNRVRELEANICGRFMHHVDGLVLDA